MALSGIITFRCGHTRQVRTITTAFRDVLQQYASQMDCSNCDCDKRNKK